jgi:acetyl-CoA synthetase
VNELQSHVKSRLAAHEYPRQVEFVESLPMTATGKVIRRLLRDKEVRNS